MHAVNPAVPSAGLRGSDPGFREFVCLVAMMMAVTAFAVDAVLPAFPAIGASLGVTEPNQLQLIVYVYMLGFGLPQLIYGPLSDIIGRRRAYLGGMVIFLVGCVMAILASSLTELLVARFVQGVGAAPGRVLSVAIVRDRFSGREMAKVMSLNMTVFITIPIFAPAIGGVLIGFGNWHVLFVAMLLSGLAIATWFWLRMPETLAPENTMPVSAARIAAGFRTALTTRQTMGYATAIAFLFGCIMAMVGSAQQIFAEAYGLGPWFPAAFALMAGSMGVAGFANSALVGRFGMHQISHVGILGLVGLGILQFGGALLFGGHPPLVWFGLVLACSQFLLGLVFPNLNALAMEPLARVAGTGASLIGVYTTILGALCGLVIGQLYDGSVMPLALGYLLLSTGTLAVVTWTERGRLLRTHHPKSAPAGADV